MAEPFFYLKSKDKDNSLILLRYKGTNPDTTWSTGEKVKTGQWNYKQGKMSARPMTDYKRVNRRLDDIKTAVKTIVRELERDGAGITPKKIKDELNVMFKQGRVTEEKQRDLKGYFTLHINTLKSNGTDSWKAYQSTLNILNDFMKRYGYHNFADIDLDFYHRFVRFMDEREYTVNYKGKMIRNLKAIMSFAYDDKYHSNDIFRSKRFASMSEDIYNIYLNIDELKQIYHKDLSHIKHLDETKDRFLLGCFIGSRFSNWVNIGEAQLTEDSIVYESVKVKERIEMPLHWIAKEIVQKYNGQLPKPISNQKMNKNLKDMGEAAEINNEVMRTRIIGGKRKVEKYKKYELITTHTARRSLATNMYLAKLPIDLCMYATGHKTITQFMKYVKSTVSENNMEELKKNPFFQK